MPGGGSEGESGQSRGVQSSSLASSVASAASVKMPGGGSEDE